MVDSSCVVFHKGLHEKSVQVGQSLMRCRFYSPLLVFSFHVKVLWGLKSLGKYQYIFLLLQILIFFSVFTKSWPFKRGKNISYVTYVTYSFSKFTYKFSLTFFRKIVPLNKVNAYIYTIKTGSYCVFYLSLPFIY